MALSLKRYSSASPPQPLQSAALDDRFFTDFYLQLLTSSWPALLLQIVGAFVVINLIFALGYYIDGAIENARPSAYLGIVTTMTGKRGRSATTSSHFSPAARVFYQAVQPWFDFWKSTFGEDGFHPWDQNAIYYAVNPAAFVCTGAAAKIVRCAGDPYHNDAHNACPGHGPNQKHSLDKEASQLWLEPGTPLRVKVCTAYASPAAKASFLDSIFAFLR